MVVHHPSPRRSERSRRDPSGSPLTRRLFLVDTSVISRRRLLPVQAALSVRSELGRLATCLPLMLEAAFSARSLADHEAIFGSLFATWDTLEPVPELTEIAKDLQRRLFEANKGRAAGVFDILVAAHALHYSDASTQVSVVHYDEDYDHLSSVKSELSTEWVVPRGSVA